MDDDPLLRKLYGLARANRADHVPKWGALIAAVVAFLTYAYAYGARGESMLLSAVMAIGAMVCALALLIAIAWPLVRHRHHRLMRERAFFIFKPGRNETRDALRQLLRLDRQLGADPLFGRLLSFIKAVPEYREDLDAALRRPGGDGSSTSAAAVGLPAAAGEAAGFDRLSPATVAAATALSGGGAPRVVRPPPRSHRAPPPQVLRPTPDGTQVPSLDLAGNSDARPANPDQSLAAPIIPLDVDPDKPARRPRRR